MTDFFTLEPGDTDAYGNQYALHDEYIAATEPGAES